MRKIIKYSFFCDTKIDFGIKVISYIFTKMFQTDLSKKYTKRELRDHIYTLPDTYIGSVDQTSIETYIYDKEEKCMVKKVITIIPGLYKIFDEIAVNALDQIVRILMEIKKGNKNLIPVKNIKFNKSNFKVQSQKRKIQKCNNKYCQISVKYKYNHKL